MPTHVTFGSNQGKLRKYIYDETKPSLATGEHVIKIHACPAIWIHTPPLWGAGLELAGTQTDAQFNIYMARLCELPTQTSIVPLFPGLATARRKLNSNKL